MNYGLTKSTIKRANIKRIENVDETNYSFVWEVNYTNICGKKLLLIVHADTRYSMIFCNIKPCVWKNISDFITRAITDAFYREGFSKDEIDKYFKLAGDIKLTPTHGAKVCGGLKHLVVELSYYEKILVDGMFQPVITDLANDLLCNIALHPEMDCIFPKRFFVTRMKELLKQ